MQNRFYFSETIGAGASATNVINLSKLMSSANRKNIPMVDRKGNAQLYSVNLRIIGAEAGLCESLAAPNTYVTKNAVKAWHEAREVMIRRTGKTLKDLGPYARHLRPFLNVNHENGTTPEVDTGTSLDGGFLGNSQFRGDEFTYTRLAVTTPAENISGSSPKVNDMVDTYSLTLCDASIAESTTPDDPDESSSTSDQDSFTSVGMIASWLESFNRQDIGTTDTDISSDNALLQLLIDSPSSEEVLELVADAQVEGRPWDGDGVQYRTMTTNGLVFGGANVDMQTVVHAPCGLLELKITNGHSAEDVILVELECVAITDM